MNYKLGRIKKRFESMLKDGAIKEANNFNKLNVEERVGAPSSRFFPENSKQYASVDGIKAPCTMSQTPPNQARAQLRVIFGSVG